VFGLVVTAEPYFAVSRPSDVVVMENVVRPDTNGKTDLIDAKYELLQRGQYEHLVNGLDLRTNRKIPLELYEARNAVQIARSSGADRYAKETFLKAESILKQAEAYNKSESKPLTMTARQAVQIAEDSRAIAVKRQDDEILANERQASADRESRADNRTTAAQNGLAAAQSETARVTREAAGDRLSAQTETDRVKRDNDAQTAAAQNEANRLKRDNDAQTAAAQLEASRLKQNNDVKMAAATTEADRLKRENDAQRISAQGELDRVGREKNQLETDKAALRAQLLLQFNSILQTSDTARGLIVNMSDVLFDTAKFSLRPEAREKLARVAGIVSGHPGLKLAVEGHTDSVGNDEYNQQLSEQRGGSVREYLMEQGMPGSTVSSSGFGKTRPVASNETVSGRQQNRRVELVISGDVIGTEIGTPIALR